MYIDFNKMNIKRNNFKSSSTENVKQEIPEEINRVIKDVENVEDFLSVHKILRNLCKYYSDFKEIKQGLYRYKDYIIAPGMKFNMAAKAGNLRNIADLNLQCAPKLIHFKILKNDEDVVLITQIPGVGSGELTEMDETVSVECKRKLVEDYDKLAKNGLFNPTITDSIQNWLVTEQGNIYIDNWSQLSGLVNDETINEGRKDLIDMCGLI